MSFNYERTTASRSIRHIVAGAVLLATLAAVALLPMVTLGRGDLFLEATPGVLYVAFYVPVQFLVAAVPANLQLRRGQLAPAGILHAYTKTAILTAFLYAGVAAVVLFTELPLLHPLVGFPVSCVATLLLYAAVGRRASSEAPSPTVPPSSPSA